MVLKLKRIGRIIIDILHLFIFLLASGRLKAIENSVGVRSNAHSNSNRVQDQNDISN